MRRGGLAALFLALLLGVAAPAAAKVEVETVAGSLAFPTNLAFGPDGRVFFTEKDTGRIRVLDRGRLVPRPFASFDVIPSAERGLLGIALHPEFEDEPWVYAYYSDASGVNRVVRVRAHGNLGGRVETLFDLLPALSGYHNGGDMAFGPDGMLYVVTGEAHEPPRAQDPADLGGKILRVEPDGSVPADNPFGPDNPAYSIGHRNSFGLCFDPETEALWETENGPQSHDEINRIVSGENYGWPGQLGAGGEPRFVDPVLVYPQVIVPTGCAFWADPFGPGDVPPLLWFGDFGGGLHRAELSPDRQTVRSERVVRRFPAGITDVAAGPDHALYVATQDAIYRTHLGAAATPSPGGRPAATPTGPAAPGATSPEGADRGVTGVAIAIAGSLAVLVAVALALRRRRT